MQQDGKLVRVPSRKWKAGVLKPVVVRKRICGKQGDVRLVCGGLAPKFSPKDASTAIAEECATRNTILKLSSSSAEEKGLNKFRIVFRWCRQRIEACPSHKACILAPTVPIIKEYFEAAKLQHYTEGRLVYRARLIIGTADVDGWGRAQWRTAVESSDIVLTTPMLFLDAVKAGHVTMSEICAVAFDECQHCIGSHPFSQLAQIACRDLEACRVLRICSKVLWKRKTPPTARAADAKRLMKALHAAVIFA